MVGLRRLNPHRMQYKSSAVAMSATGPGVVWQGVPHTKHTAARLMLVGLGAGWPDDGPPRAAAEDARPDEGGGGERTALMLVVCWLCDAELSASGVRRKSKRQPLT
jgi:hypothetical protein